MGWYAPVPQVYRCGPVDLCDGKQAALGSHQVLPAAQVQTALVLVHQEDAGVNLAGSFAQKSHMSSSLPQSLLRRRLREQRHSVSQTMNNKSLER
ncbi:hypothetical protein EYF80_014918 [Liparis tanakae]|uniref:Uncharacterized protein n=1 Tax=Liparis tanakae TaxID=230148 RepID=A0A4Z2IA16_9TELE|nr:hypothetical protein EYF80_014918 [Liparis tanakae]